MSKIITLWIILIGISLASNQNYFIINHLVVKNGKILKPFTNERVIGDIYRYFVNDNLKSENVFVGKITKNGKQGIWTRWWNNGGKKIQGYYIDSGAKHFIINHEGMWSNDDIIINTSKKIRYNKELFPEGINVNFFKFTANCSPFKKKKIKKFRLYTITI